MATTSPVDKKYIKDLRLELMFVCMLHDLSHADIARVFNIDRANINRVLKKHKALYEVFCENHVRRAALVNLA